MRDSLAINYVEKHPCSLTTHRKWKVTREEELYLFVIRVAGLQRLQRLDAPLWGSVRQCSGSI